MAHPRNTMQCAYDKRYPFYSLSTYIPSWLDEPLQLALVKHNVTKQDVVVEALAQFLGVTPPPGRRLPGEPSPEFTEMMNEVFGKLTPEEPQHDPDPMVGTGPILVK